MSAQTVLNLVYVLAVILISLLLLLIPLKYLTVVTRPFSFKTFGIRKIKRWNSKTDTLANFFLWITVIASVVLPFIEFGQYIYALWLTLAWLAAASRAIRLSQVKSDASKMVVLFFVTVIYGISMLGILGLFNGNALWHLAGVWMQDLYHQNASSLLYYVTSIGPACYLNLVLLMMVPGYILWSQFKYMRLENSFNSRNLVFYIIKSIFQVLVVLFLGMFALSVIEDIYAVQMADRVTRSFWPVLFGFFD